MAKQKQKISRPIYAKKPSGKLFNIRQWFGYSLLIILVVAPFIKLKGEPLLLFNIIERKFVLFGTVFWPQDLHIFVFGMLIFMVFIVLFTVVYGRVWCGWACPQTIFMELIFRRIEYWIEGDAHQQKKLNQGPNTPSKVIKKVIKHSLFLLISFVISNIFLSYVIGLDALIQIIREPIGAHLGGLIAMVVFSLIFYGVFAYVREIVCTTICPYGRLQGVLLDENSLAVAYHCQRGEPRGFLKKGLSDPLAQGDCIDCNLCVQVCPTGIDIREGLQLECINCTACIDACDTVMDKIGRPRKLIGFYSSKEIKENSLKTKNTRAWAYSIVLVILMIVLGWLLWARSSVGTTLLRAKGTTYQVNDDGSVSNLYTLELINKSAADLPFQIQMDDPTYTIQLVNPRKMLKKGETAQMSLFIRTQSNTVKQYKNEIKIKIQSGDQVLKTIKTTFVAPIDL